MSGEYFCIEEIDADTYYNEGYDESEPPPMNQQRPDDGKSAGKMKRKDAEIRSNSSKKSQDIRLYEIEEELGAAENRCNNLKIQLESMKKIYEKAQRISSPEPRKTALHAPKKVSGQPVVPVRTGFRRKIARRRPGSPARTLPQTKIATILPPELHESSESVPRNSSSSSTDLRQKVKLHPKTEMVLAPLQRQNPTAIETDTSGAAVKTITNILAGITSNVNRAAKVKRYENAGSRVQSRAQSRAYEDSTMITEIAGQVSPRVEQRILEQQRRIEELARAAESWTRHNLETLGSASSIKTTAKITKTISSKLIGTPLKKSKNRIGGARVKNVLKNTVKATAKHVINTTRLRPLRTSMVGEDTRSADVLIGKKQKAIKRLRGPPNRVTETQSFSNKLVELYHNEKARTSESDDSNHKITPPTRQKGGGDLAVEKIVIPSIQLDPDVNHRQVQLEPIIQHNDRKSSETLHHHKNQTSKFTASNRLLTPIYEQGTYQPIFESHQEFCEPAPLVVAPIRNYEVPTIASRLKQVAKSYISAFSFRKIPFCVAKSTTQSHNIGVNIQQVMSIIKTRQPITGISPTLAHNIGLAAGNFDDTLTNLVSTIGSKMNYRQSRCPLVKSAIDYAQLQEIAKEVEDEDGTLDQRQGFAGDGVSDRNEKDNVSVCKPEGETCKDPTSVDNPMIVSWSVDRETHAQRCICTPTHKSSQGVPLQEVVSRFQASVQDPSTKPSFSATAPISQQKSRLTAQKVATTTSMRTRNWVNSIKPVPPPPPPQTLPPSRKSNKTVTTAVSTENQPNSDIKGKERNLKTVLKNLYQEFDNMNSRYDTLSKSVEAANNRAQPDALRQLEDMESALDKKEEEINMVMSLYTEVLALKDQVKKLREKASQPGVSVSGGRLKIGDEPATHLTQLLRQIQNYQIRCKNRNGT